MRTDPPETAIGAMFCLTAIAVGLVWLIETFTRMFR